MQSERIICSYVFKETLNPAPYEFSKHFHYGYELILVCEGEIELLLCGKRERAERGSLIVISDMDEHDIKVLKYPYRRHVLQFDRELTDKYIISPKILGVFKNHGEGFEHVVRAFDGSVEETVNKIGKNYFMKEELKEEYINCLAKELLIEIYRLAKGKNLPSLEGRRFETVAKIQRYVDENFKSDISVNRLASEFYLSRYYMSRLFKEYTGLSLKKYIMLLKLNCAKQLLLRSELTLNEIVANCKMGDVNNFIRYFKREYGISPVKFKKLYLKEGEREKK